MLPISLGRRLRGHSLTAGLIVSVLATGVLLVGLDLWSSRQARSVEIAQAWADTTNLARSLAEHAHGTIQAADTLLIGIRSRMEERSALTTVRVHQLLVTDAQSLPSIRGLAVIDADGTLIASSNPTRPSRPDYSSRPYFQYHRTHPGRGVHVGDPIRVRSDGTWIIPVTQRIDAPDGSFGGVVIAGISVDSIEKFYETFRLGKRGIIALVSADGILIARTPHGAKMTGMNVSDAPIFRHLARDPVGSLEYESYADRTVRLGSYRRLDDYPLVVAVALGKAEVLAGWHWNARLHLVISGGIATVLWLLGIYFARQIKHGQDAERLYRLLADNSSDAIVRLGLDGRRLYVSPAFTTLTGWNSEESLGLNWGSQVHPEDRERVVAVRGQILNGAEQIVTSFRLVCKDGTSLWVEARMRLVAGEGGEEPYLVANIRDFSEHKAAEEELRMLHRELAAQASTDSLTGLANRRRFDEALQQEWRRAARGANCLSLLMIDVDRFKLYNDRYGHQQGDRCLRTIAGTIADFARRPGDLAARYGGEEIAMLLAGASAEGSAQIAERARGAIQALGLVHEDNPPSGVVTASFGGATMFPKPDDFSGAPEELVAAADAALYEAKGAGRNGVVIRAMIPIP